MIKGQNGQPLTLHYIWSEVCKMKRNEILTALKSVNREHTIYVGDNNAIFVSAYNATSTAIMLKCRHNKQTKPKPTKSKPDKISSGERVAVVVETNNEKPHNIAQIQQTYLDETIPYDFEAVLNEQQQDRAHQLSSFPRMVNDDEAKDILQLWQNGKRRN